MKAMDNGALLALGVVGLVTVAGRVRRGSFAVDWRPDAQHVLRQSEADEYVDSGDLSNLLYYIKDDPTVPSGVRNEAEMLYIISEENERLDTGIALQIVQAALKSGSRSVHGMSIHDAGHVLRLGQQEPRKKAGEALNDYRWHYDRALAQFKASKVEQKGQGGSRAFLLDDPEYTHYVVHVPSMEIASGWSYAGDAKEALADMGPAKAHCRVYTRKYLRDQGRDPRHNGNWASRGQF